MIIRIRSANNPTNLFILAEALHQLLAGNQSDSD